MPDETRDDSVLKAKTVVDAYQDEASLRQSILKSRVRVYLSLAGFALLATLSLVYGGWFLYKDDSQSAMVIYAAVQGVVTAFSAFWFGERASKNGGSQ